MRESSKAILKEMPFAIASMSQFFIKCKVYLERYYPFKISVVNQTKTIKQ
jgi:hypothetical protein